MAMWYRRVSVLLPEPPHNQNSSFMMEIQICNTQNLVIINGKKKKNGGEVVSALGYERSGPRFDSRRP